MFSLNTQQLIELHEMDDIARFNILNSSQYTAIAIFNYKFRCLKMSI